MVTPMRSGPEFDLIRSFLNGAEVERPDVRVGPGDDAAVVTGDGVVLSSDLSIEGIHFQREWIPSYDIGWRAAAAALSDLAAMAARPIGLLASIGVPDDDAGDLARAVMAGVCDAATEAGAALLGGDLSRSPGPLVLDVTVVGAARAPVLRSGGRAGQELWVTGELGGAAACLAAFLGGRKPSASALQRFARPRPRIREALWLHARSIPRSMLDLSDGLAGDAGHLAAASGVAAVLSRDAVPIDPAAAEAAPAPEQAFAMAVSGGEDYELCFSAEAGSVDEHVAGFAAEFGLALTRVGALEAGEGVWWDGGTGPRERVTGGGYQHFGGGA